jgi:signal transduction histidine kinase
LLFIALFALVFGAFSVIFYIAITGVLAPAFDLAPELSSEQAAELAYRATVDRIGMALLLGNVLVVAFVGIIAWILASRTLKPIREAHLRQRRFVADASHEMRTPLAAIRASAEGALSSPATTGGESMRGALEVVVSSADRLTRLTNDLLLLARTDEVPAARREAVDLSVVVAETAEAFALAHADLPQPRLTLTEDLRVLADPDEIGRIVANLLDNAYRYGEMAPTAAVRMSTRSVEREAIVEVSDTGAGIAAADLDRIFEPFHRVRSDAAAPDGNGLGLAIGRGLAERNGGRLSVVSQPGAGSTFRLSLPRFR